VVPLVHAAARRAAGERPVRRPADAALVDRIAALAAAAPDVVAVWRGIDEGALITVRREVRRRAGAGTAEGIAAQLGAVAAALRVVVEALPERAFALPGGEGGWNVAQALGHTADARAGLAMAGALAASGRWPDDAPEVVPGIPGAPDATRDQLLRRLAVSQRVVERSARSIAGHETEPCPLVHPLVGRMRCGEWLLFAGVHDLMHLEQLSSVEEALR
jgi:DinB superfamily